MKTLNSIHEVMEGIILCPSICEDFISTEYGIKGKVDLIDGRPAIKFYNHLSLFSMINKIRRNYDFTVLHKKEKNEYILIIGKRYS